MGPPRKQVRATVARHLLNAAIALTILPLIANILFLLAGTFQLQDTTRPGATRIGLSSLSIASFNGVITSSTPSPSYLVNIQFFPNAFTFFYPSSPTANTTSGILQSGPSSSFDPLNLIKLLPSTLDLPASDTACLSHPYRRGSQHDDGPDKCSPFWWAIHRAASSPFRFQLEGIAAYFLFVTHLSAVVVLLLTLFSEVLIIYRPGWMRCQCWFHFLKKYCPLPKGTAEEMKDVSEHRWDRVRLWMYGLVVAYCVIPVQFGMVMGWFFARSMEDLERKGEMTVDASIGRGFMVVGWGAVVVSGMAVACAGVRFLLTRWREEAEGEEERGLLVGLGEGA